MRADTIGRSILPKAVLAGVISCILGTIFIFGSFSLLLRSAEHLADTKLPNDTLMGMFHRDLLTAFFAVGGVAFAWFAFGFFIAYSRMSSQAELGE